MNQKLVKILTMMKVLREMEDQIYKARAYDRVIKNIIKYDKEIETINEASKISGVGTNILSKIQNIFHNTDDQKTGIYELDSLSDEDYNKLFTIVDMIDISGIGIKTAERMYNDGIRTIEQIQQIGTTRQKIGAQYLEHMNKRINREDIDNFNQMLTNFVDNTGITFFIGGSYSRGLNTSSDVDILFYYPGTDPGTDLNYANEVIEELKNQGIILETLSFNDQHFEGIANIGNSNTIITRLDIWFISDITEIPYFMLYIIGNEKLNRDMRSKAMSLGMTLTNNKMTDNKTGNKILVDDERDIFKILNIPYLEYNERNL